VIASLVKDIFGKVILKNERGEILAEYPADTFKDTGKLSTVEINLIEQFLNTIPE